MLFLTSFLVPFILLLYSGCFFKKSATPAAANENDKKNKRKERPTGKKSAVKVTKTPPKDTKPAKETKPSASPQLVEVSPRDVTPPLKPEFVKVEEKPKASPEKQKGKNAAKVVPQSDNKSVLLNAKPTAKKPKVAANNKKSEYVAPKEEAPPAPKAAPPAAKKRSLPNLPLNSTQPETLPPLEKKESKRTHKFNLKPGQFNEQSDNTFEDVPQVPERPEPSSEQPSEPNGPATADGKKP